MSLNSSDPLGSSRSTNSLISLDDLANVCEHSNPFPASSSDQVPIINEILQNKNDKIIDHVSEYTGSSNDQQHDQFNPNEESIQSSPQQESLTNKKKRKEKYHVDASKYPDTVTTIIGLQEALKLKFPDFPIDLSDIQLLQMGIENFVYTLVQRIMDKRIDELTKAKKAPSHAKRFEPTDFYHALANTPALRPIALQLLQSKLIPFQFRNMFNFNEEEKSSRQIDIGQYLLYSGTGNVDLSSLENSLTSINENSNKSKNDGGAHNPSSSLSSMRLPIDSASNNRMFDSFEQHYHSDIQETFLSNDSNQSDLPSDTRYSYNTENSEEEMIDNEDAESEVSGVDETEVGGWLLDNN